VTQAPLAYPAMSQKTKKQKLAAAPVKEQKKASTPAKGSKNLYILLLLAVTTILFYPSLSYLLVDWDDNINLYQNKTLDSFASQWNWEQVKLIFTSDVGGNYNPLPIFTFAIEKYLFANDPVETPGIFHFTNLVLHLVCSILVFKLFTRLGLGIFFAFAGALLFGIHPMRIESVVWVTERKDVLYGAFFLGALLTYLNYVKGEADKYKWYGLTILLSVFSYFAKIQAVTLPLTMVALDFFIGRKWLTFKTLVIEKLPWWCLSLAFGLINIYFLRNAETIADDLFQQHAFLDRLAIGAYSYLVYLAKFVYPYSMSPMYPYPAEIPTAFYAALVIAPLAVIFFVLRAWKKKYHAALFAWGFFTFNVIFMLQIVGAGQAFLADRFTYIAYIGGFFFVAWGLQYIHQKYPVYKNVSMGFTALYLVFMFFIGMQQIPVWENSGTLWSKVIREYPNTPHGYVYAGQYYRDALKEYQTARPYFVTAVKIQPENAEYRNSLSKLYVDYASSITGASQADKSLKRLMLDSAMLHYDLALHYDSLDKKQKAERTGEIFINRGGCLLLLGYADQALQDLSTGISKQPKNENGYANRALIYISRKQNDLAIKDFDSYLKLKPFQSNMYYERGMCKFRIGQNEAALQDIAKAFELGDKRPLYNLGRAQIYRAMGNMDAMRREALIAKQGGLNVPAEFLQ
jgi:tetratricopeptide (TPR) repeat protein